MQVCILEVQVCILVVQVCILEVRAYNDEQRVWGVKGDVLLEDFLRDPMFFLVSKPYLVGWGGQ